MTPLTERNMLPQRGASFFRDPDGEVLFQFVVDTSNIIGPRKASKADSEKHSEAWSRFVHGEQPREPEPVIGGSLTVEQVTGQPEGSEPPRRKTLRLKAV